MIMRVTRGGVDNSNNDLRWVSIMVKVAKRVMRMMTTMKGGDGGDNSDAKR